MKKKDVRVLITKDMTKDYENVIVEEQESELVILQRMTKTVYIKSQIIGYIIVS